MEKSSYDFVVLGGGSGGYAAARTACDFGLKTAVIDGAAELGGLCILRGCMPSKTLIESANRARAARQGSKFGVNIDSVSVDAQTIIERKRELIAEFAGYRQGQLESGRFELIRGTARFKNFETLEISLVDGGTSEVAFKSACVATGSVISEIPIPGLKESGYWTSDDILDATELPESFTVLGGGAIALEMACYLEGLGKNVTVVQRSGQLLSGSDADVADALEKALQSRSNFEIFTGTTLQDVSIGPDGKKVVRFLHGDEEKTVANDEILQALGRRPHSKGLNLESAGIETSQSGLILCNEFQQTTNPRVFAVGDVCGPHEVVHIAIEQGEKAAENSAILLGETKGEMKAMDYRLKLLGIFTDPQVAMVGLTETEARAKGIDVVSASYPFDDHGKSMIMDELHGFVKLLADSSSGELVGGAVVGPEAVELIHEIVVAMNFGATASEFLKIPHYHPTLSEIWTYPAEDLIM